MLFSAFITTVPTMLLEGGIITVIIDVLVSHHTRKLQKDIRDREYVIDERLDHIEKNQVETRAILGLKIEQLQKDVVNLDDCKMTRPPRDY